MDVPWTTGGGGRNSGSVPRRNTLRYPCSPGTKCRLLSRATASSFWGVSARSLAWSVKNDKRKKKNREMEVGVWMTLESINELRVDGFTSLCHAYETEWRVVWRDAFRHRNNLWGCELRMPRRFPHLFVFYRVGFYLLLCWAFLIF